jgi:serine/threonine protein kinase
MTWNLDNSYKQDGKCISAALLDGSVVPFRGPDGQEVVVKTANLEKLDHQGVPGSRGYVAELPYEGALFQMHLPKSPHLVEVLDVKVTGKRLSVVMPRYDGDLFQLLQTRQAQIGDRRCIMHPAVAIGVLLQIARALKIIHDLGWAHMDLSSENILYRRIPGGKVQFALTDFGLAHLRNKECRPAAGKAVYMSLELSEAIRCAQVHAQNGGDLAVSKRCRHVPGVAAGRDGRVLVGDPAATDVYAIGAILWSMCTGSMPSGAPVTRKDSSRDFRLKHGSRELMKELRRIGWMYSELPPVEITDLLDKLLADVDARLTPDELEPELTRVHSMLCLKRKEATWDDNNLAREVRGVQRSSSSPI